MFGHDNNVLIFETNKTYILYWENKQIEYISICIKI